MIHRRLETLATNAVFARYEVESRRAAALDAVSTSADEESRAEAFRAINARAAELEEEISHAEASKASTLEAELVAVDAALELLQAGAAGAQAECARFGKLPLEPAESGTLRLARLAPVMCAEQATLASSLSVPSSALGTLCAPRAVEAAEVHIRHLPGFTVAWAGRHFRFEATIDARDGSCTEEMRLAAEHLAARIRVAAALIPVAGQEREPPGTPQRAPIPLCFTCIAMVGGVSVRVAVPSLEFLPDQGAWELQVQRVAIGGSAVPLGPLVKSLPVRNRPSPGPRWPAGALHAACRAGNSAEVRRILSSATFFSTEESDEVSMRAGDRLKAKQEEAPDALLPRRLAIRASPPPSFTPVILPRAVFALASFERSSRQALTLTQRRVGGAAPRSCSLQRGALRVQLACWRMRAQI